MKALILCAALASTTFPALAQTNVSISIGQPGFYGRLDIGDFRDYGPPPVYVTRHNADLASEVKNPRP